MRYRNCIWILGECCCCKAAAQGRPTIPYVSLSRSPSLSLPLSLSPSLPPSLPPLYLANTNGRVAKHTSVASNVSAYVFGWRIPAQTHSDQKTHSHSPSSKSILRCASASMHVCKNACTHARMYARMHLCMNACTHECVYARMHS